jgi:ribosomal protein S6
MANPCDFYINGKKMKMDEFLSYAKKLPHSQLNDILGGIPSFKNIPTAPFVTDTNAWVKLSLKVALKEAVKQGISKIGWTTGEQQNERYDLSKQVDEIKVLPQYGGSKMTYGVQGFKDGKMSTTMAANSIAELEGIIGKELAKKVADKGEFEGELSFTGNDLKVGGKGMKGFYGSPTEGSLGIVGNVAKSLTKQEVGTVQIGTVKFEKIYNVENYDEFPKEVNDLFLNLEDADNDQEIANGLKKLGYTIIDQNPADFSFTKFGKKEGVSSTQHSIDITPELKQQVSEGLPLFMASAPKEDFTEALNEYDNLIKNPKGTTEYIKKFGLEKIKKIKDITSNFGTYIAALEKSNYITKKIC